MKLFFTILLLCNIFILQTTAAFNLHNGDLIFQESCNKQGIGNAIKKVTKSSGNYQFTHVGIVYIPKGSDSVFVIEATVPKVKITPIREYLYPSDERGCYPKSIVGRLKRKYRHCIPQAIEEAKKMVGKGYDYGFVLGNDKYYCSELVYEVLFKANHNKPIFPLNTMTFKEQGTDSIDAGWAKYFAEHKLAIPEGKQGINPGAMSKSKVLKLIGEIK